MPLIELKEAPSLPPFPTRRAHNMHVHTIRCLILGGNGTATSGLGDCRGGVAPSVPVITRHRPLYFSEMGSSVLLPCQASGNPRPRVYWLDGENLPLMDPRFQQQPNGDLLISNLRWQDMDGYKCVAKSPEGEAEAVTFLYPAAKVRNLSIFKAIHHFFILFKRFLRKVIRL